MTRLSIPYASSQVVATVSDDIPVDWILPPKPPTVDDPTEMVRQALTHPLNGFQIEKFKGVRSVAITINDKTRPVPHHILLPPLIEQILEIGVPVDMITIWIASGTHRPMQPSEFQNILYEGIPSSIRVYAHDCDVASNLVDLGKTSAGTPIFVNKEYYQSELRIVVGTLEPHHFMGYSGGVKTAAIGLAGRETISKNHAFLTNPNATTGKYETNPMRVDVEEIGERIGIHFALNAILSPKKQFVSVLAGDPRSVMRQGIPVSEKYCQVEVDRDYSLVIASPGGHPKDINFYQAQKGLTNAACIARDGAIIILAAACPEGAGNIHYEAWMHGKTSHLQVLEDFSREPFRVGPHKAYLTARIGVHSNLLIVSEMHDDLIRLLNLVPAGTFQQAINSSLSTLRYIDRIAVLPYASTTVPKYRRADR